MKIICNFGALNCTFISLGVFRLKNIMYQLFICHLKTKNYG